MADGTCSEEGCEDPIKARQLCNKHYIRFRHDGSLPLLPPLTVEDRFWAKVTKTDTCWIWKRATRSGYGIFAVTPKDLRPAHRFAYEQLVGPVPDGLCVLHRCDNRPCVRPEHLFLGTKADNTADMIAKGRAVNPQAAANRAKTHCPQGHPYSKANTYIERSGARQCRTCNRERSTRFNRLRRNKGCG